MYEFVNRFSHSDDPSIVTSLNPILGGPGWLSRLDLRLTRGLAVEKLFRETLKSSGNFDFVISTRIDKATAERPHFFIAYGTKSKKGLTTFREIEYEALRAHMKARANVREKKREERFSTGELFAGYDAAVQEASLGQIVEDQKVLAAKALMACLLVRRTWIFSGIVVELLQAYFLRETNVKDICVELARAGRIENTWGAGNRKPRDETTIELKAGAASHHAS
jgi:hypothetical protein